MQHSQVGIQLQQVHFTLTLLHLDCMCEHKYVDMSGLP